MEPAVIRDQRLKRGLSQEALAREVGVTHHVVYRWEKGTYSPSPENESRLLEVFQRIPVQP